MFSKKISLLLWLIIACQLLHAQIKPTTNLEGTWFASIVHRCPDSTHCYFKSMGEIDLVNDNGLGLKGYFETALGELKIRHLHDDIYSFEISNIYDSQKGEIRYSVSLDGDLLHYTYSANDEVLSGSYEAYCAYNNLRNKVCCCPGTILLYRPNHQKEKELKTEKEINNQQKVVVNNLHELSTGSKYTLKNVIFPLSSSQLEPSSFTELNKVYEILEKNKKMVIRLEGHTDVIGNHKANKKLSKERVKAIKKFLTQKGIASKRIKLKWYGDTRPLMVKGSVKEREVNRRVELVVISS